jgi:hypothetical protein
LSASIFPKRDHAFIATVDGTLFSLAIGDKAAGAVEIRVVDEQQLEGATGPDAGPPLLIGGPILADGRLYVSGDLAGLVCFQSGEERQP